MLSARKLISEEKIQEFSAEQGFKVEKEDLEEISEKKKYFYAQLLHSKKYNSKDLEEATGIAAPTLRQWKSRWKGRKPLNKGPARVTHLSADTGELIRKAVNEADAAFNCLTTTDVQKIATQEAIDHFVINPGTEVSVTLIQKKVLLFGLKLSVGQFSAQARVRAAREIRNFFTYACGISAVREVVPTAKFINFDTTQVKIHFHGGNNVKAVTLVDRDFHHPVNREGANDDSPDGVFVKIVVCVSAGGKAAPPVFVQADSRLKKGEFDATKVPGLGVGLGADDDANYGYVVFVETRGSMPRSFTEWYFREVVAPFASELDRVHPEGKVCVLMDGEPSQVMAIVGDPEQPPTALFHFLKQRGIIVVKLPASCSMLLQPADVMSLFKVMKKLLLGMGNEEWNLLYDNCLAPVMGHIRSLYAARKRRNGEMDTSNKRLIRQKAIAAASYALRESLNQKQILAGFYYNAGCRQSGKLRF